jgi:hypothetical protein
MVDNTLKMKFNIKYLLVNFFLLASCVRCNDSDRNFYSAPYKEDLMRIPLIFPYELFIQNSADSDYFPTHGWNLNFLHNKFLGYVSHVNVSYINIEKRIIYGHGKDGKTPAPNFWFVIIPYQKFEEIFAKEKEWKDFLQSKSVNPQKLFSVWTVFEDFKNNETLPWHNSQKIHNYQLISQCSIALSGNREPAFLQDENWRSEEQAGRIPFQNKKSSRAKGFRNLNLLVSFVVLCALCGPRSFRSKGTLRT